VLLTPPPVLRFEVKTAGAPVRGNPSAPVTIVEFSDFQCPFCRKVQPVLEQVRAKYGDKVKIVYREFPLVSCKARRCRSRRLRQRAGKFWVHDVVFRIRRTPRRRR
jgi:thiol-disulfide isomerase/thioredoxin